MKVVVRVRPPSEEKEPATVSVSGNSVSIAVEGQPTTHEYDHVFDYSSTNQQIADAAINPMFKQLAQGISSVIIAYGSSKSGRSWLMRF